MVHTYTKKVFVKKNRTKLLSFIWQPYPGGSVNLRTNLTIYCQRATARPSQSKAQTLHSPQRELRDSFNSISQTLKDPMLLLAG